MEQDLEAHVWRQAKARCEYCQMPQEYDGFPLEIDHVIANKHEGSTVAANLALACSPCNTYKGPHLAGPDPLTKKLPARFNPRKHKGERHFRWDGAILAGKTPI